jgi:hypothetical protein
MRPTHANLLVQHVLAFSFLFPKLPLRVHLHERVLDGGDGET